MYCSSRSLTPDLHGKYAGVTGTTVACFWVRSRVVRRPNVGSPIPVAHLAHSGSITMRRRVGAERRGRTERSRRATSAVSTGAPAASATATVVTIALRSPSSPTAKSRCATRRLVQGRHTSTPQQHGWRSSPPCGPASSARAEDSQPGSHLQDLTRRPAVRAGPKDVCQPLSPPSVALATGARPPREGWRDFFNERASVPYTASSRG
jgi:hypothetical protein